MWAVPVVEKKKLELVAFVSVFGRQDTCCRGAYEWGEYAFEKMQDMPKACSLPDKSRLSFLCCAICVFRCSDAVTLGFAGFARTTSGTPNSPIEYGARVMGGAVEVETEGTGWLVVLPQDLVHTHTAAQQHQRQPAETNSTTCLGEHRKESACPYSPLHTGAKGWGSCVMDREAYRDRVLAQS